MQTSIFAMNARHSKISSLELNVFKNLSASVLGVFTKVYFAGLTKKMATVQY